MRDRLIARDSLVLAIVSTGAVHQSMPLLLLKAHLFFDHVSLTSKPTWPIQGRNLCLRASLHALLSAPWLHFLIEIQPLNSSRHCLPQAHA